MNIQSHIHAESRSDLRDSHPVHIHAEMARLLQHFHIWSHIHAESGRMDLIYVKFMSKFGARSALSRHADHKITTRITSEKILQAKITSRHPGSHPCRIFTSDEITCESHPKSHLCRIHSLPRRATPSAQAPARATIYYIEQIRSGIYTRTHKNTPNNTRPKGEPHCCTWERAPPCRATVTGVRF